MPSKLRQLADLLRYVRADGRICPQPPQWKALWEMLPDRRRTGSGWKPVPLLILAAWWNTSSLAKQQRFQEHIEHAAQHGALDAVGAFFRDLKPEHWNSLEEA